jgi:Phasin protein
MSQNTIGTALVVAGRNSSRHGEMAVASAQVVAKRMTLGAQAMFNPAGADHAEFARMMPEKARAFTDAGFILLKKSLAIMSEMSRFALDETGRTAQAACTMAACRTPQSLLAAQTRYATGWFSRVTAHSMALSVLTLRAQGAAMKPVHRAATANAERLAA